MARPVCPFCGFDDREVVIAGDDVAFAIVSKPPIQRYHALVVPRAHYESFVELPDEVASRIFVLARRVSAAIRRVSRPDAITHISDDDIRGTGSIWWRTTSYT